MAQLVFQHQMLIVAYNSSNSSNRAIMAHGNNSNEFSISAHQAERLLP